MQPNTETKHLNCHCDSTIPLTAEASVKYLVVHASTPTLFLPPLFFSSSLYTGREDRQVPPTERPVVHINCSRTHDIKQLLWCTGVPCCLKLQYFFPWLYLSIRSTRKICTPLCWRVDMKCCLDYRNGIQNEARIWPKRLDQRHGNIRWRVLHR
jgi:hypothetical protein